jgi:hypothetical protein
MDGLERHLPRRRPAFRRRHPKTEQADAKHKTTAEEFCL